MYKDTKYSNTTGDITSTMKEILVRNLRRAYYGAISYIDSLIGKVVNRIGELVFYQNTIISFFGDHGWQLGEHEEWCKQ